MSLQLVSPPAAEPVALADAKAHLKIDTADDDALITALIVAARTRAEWHTRRALVTQSWVLWRDTWPDAPFEIPLPPLQSLTSITLYDLNDAATVLDPSTYRVDNSAMPARIAWKETVQPPVTPRNMNALAVAFTAGYGAAVDVPQLIREAILEIVADLYANRGDIAGEPPLAALALLAPYRVVGM